MNSMIFMKNQTPLRKLLMMHLIAGGVPILDYTVTGNPVSFLTNVAKPLSVLAAFSPVQAGSGDPSPDNVRPITGWSGAKVTRSGKNLFSYNADNVKQETTSSSTTRAVYHTGIISDGSTKFTFSAYPKTPGTLSSAHINVGYYENGIATAIDYFILAGGADRTPTLSLSAGREVIIMYTDTSVSAFKMNLEKYNIQIEIGSSATRFEEYTGESVSVTFPATGKNLVHSTPYGGQFFNVQAGTDLAKVTTRASVTESGNTITLVTEGQWYGRIFATDMLPPGTYNVHAEPGGEHCMVSVYETDKDLVAKARYAFTTNNKSVTIAESARIVVTINNDDTGGGTVTLQNLQVESGSSYTSWEPFTNTVYGGTLDLTTGTLTVEYKDFTKTWGDYIAKTDLGDNTRGVLSIANYPSKTVDQAADAKCNVAQRGTGWSEDTVHFYTNEGSCIVILPNDTDDSTEIQVVYPLATPLVYQLTPAEILSLVGNNVVWSDLNGNLTVKYKKKG